MPIRALSRSLRHSLAAFAVIAAPALLAAQGERLPLTQDTYDLWRSILQPTLSPDGKWAVYTLTPTVGDGMLVARATSGTTEHRVARGWTGRPLTSVTGTPFSAQAAQITGDSRYVVFLRYPEKGAMDSARAKKVRPADQPKNALAILALETGAVTTIAKVRGFQLPRDGGRFVFFQTEVDSSATGSARAAGAGARGAAGAAATAGASANDSASKKPKKDTGAPLVIRELASGQQTTIEGVTGYVVDRTERILVYAVAGADSLKVDGVYARDLTTGTVTPLKTGTGNYRALALDEAGTQVAFVTDAEEFTSAEKPRMALYHAALTGPRGRPGPQPATLAVAPTAVGEGLRIADRGVDFVRTGAVVRFGIAKVLPDSIPADSLAEKAVVDLWHWQDARPQPMQRLQAAQDRARSWVAVYHVAIRQMRRIGSDSLPQVTLSDDGRTAVASTSVPYELDAIRGENGYDIHLLNTVTGASRQLATKVRAGGQLSPAAKFVTWWEGGRYRVHEVASGRTRDLTAGITGIRFENEEHDTPSEPTPYGLGGWTTGDARVLVYDRYDIWEVDPLGVAAPRVLTDSVGRRDQLTFRAIPPEAELRAFDPATPLTVRAFDNVSKAAGFYRERLGVTSAPERIVMAPKSWPVYEKARRADQVLVARADYREFPNLWTGRALDQLTQISDVMPEQARYRWGNVQLVTWANLDGVPMEGLLFTPEGFDSTKAYPMVTYFYEQLSDGLHSYVRPAGRNTINPVVYTSLGYLVFMPNIHYTPGYPGPSAVKAIVPGVQSLIARGIADPKRQGISGQSWGGYQTSYVITQTSLFAAAVPNATVVNMTSAYGGIRWESGVERAIVNYERGQSRIGGSLWEYPERYLENSPLFFLDRVTTPILFMANDADGAVPWYQGIEYFVAMRRLGKEAYMLNYNGDAHNPRKYANQKDVDRRMQEFFAAKLLGAPAPDWMQRGIPFLEKGRDQLVRP